MKVHKAGEWTEAKAVAHAERDAERRASYYAARERIARIVAFLRGVPTFCGCYGRGGLVCWRHYAPPASSAPVYVYTSAAPVAPELAWNPPWPVAPEAHADAYDRSLVERDAERAERRAAFLRLPAAEQARQRAEFTLIDPTCRAARSGQR